MEKDRKSRQDADKISKEIQRKFSDLFSEGAALPTHLSMREVEALNARIRELEVKLAGQASEAAPISPITTLEADAPAAPSAPAEPARKIPPPSAITPETPHPARFPRLARLWNKLTGAHPSIQEPGERQQAQLAAAIALGLVIFTFIGLIAGVAVNARASARANNSIILLVLTIFVLLIYGIARGRYYRLGSAALVGIFVAAGFGLALSNPGRESVDFYSMLPIALILGSVLLPMWGLAVLTGVNFLAVFLFPNIVSTYAAADAATDAGILLTLGILLIIAVAYRNSVGRLRVAEVTTVNKELQSIRASLEQRVEDRTHDMELASEVGRTIAEKVADLREMLTSAVELIRARFNLYYTQIYLADPSGKILHLRAGTGEVGQALLKRGHHLPINSGSLNGRAATDKKPVIVEDTTSTPTFLPNPLLPNTRSEMAIPLIAGGQVIGVLDMQSETPGKLNETNLSAFEALAGQLAIAIQNAALFAETKQAHSEVDAQVHRLTEEGWREFLDAIERGQKIGFAFDQTNLIALEADALDRVPTDALMTPITVTGEQIGAFQLTPEAERIWTADETEVLRATAVQLGQHLENLRLLAQTERYRDQAEQVNRRLTREGWKDLRTRGDLAPGYAYDLNEVKQLFGSDYGSSNTALKRPLIVHDETVGELEVDLEATHVEATEIISAVAEQLSGHLENLRLTEQNEKRAHELETVAEVSATTSATLDPDALLQAVVDLTKERFGVYHAHIYQADDTRQTLLLAAGAGEVGRKMVAQGHAIALDAEKSLVARAAREHHAVIVNDVRNDPGFLPNPLLPMTRSEMAVPMIVGEKVLGVFDVQSDTPNYFSEEDAYIYTTLASQVAIALQNARLYAEQAATVTQLRELDRLKSSFLANMSHELRTPLNSILGFADVMLEELDGPLSKNMNTDLSLIQKNGQHLLHLINDVLDMAKIEAGKMNLNPEQFKVQEIFDEVVSIASPLANEKSLAMFIEDDSDRMVEITADRTRLRQVMINLVNNALKFTEKGKVSLRVTSQEEKILISVRDTGMGIPTDKLEVIFQEFTQVDTTATRKVGGTGLGLPISRRLIEMHGGRLWAESTGVSGEGSVFYVELPLIAVITEPIEKTEK